MKKKNIFLLNFVLSHKKSFCDTTKSNVHTFDNTIIVSRSLSFSLLVIRLLGKKVFNVDYHKILHN